MPGRRSNVSDEALDLICAEADGAAYGVAAATDDPKNLRARLYPAMKRTGTEFTLRIPGKENELWLIKKG